MGSIGRRHLRVLGEIEPIDVIHFKSGSGADANGSDSIQHVDTMDLALASNPDFAIISNPTGCHVPLAIQVAQAGIPFIIEKPVSASEDGLDELSSIVAEKKLPVMVGFQMRHHPGFIKTSRLIKDNAIGDVLHFSGYVGQYLPDWRPDTDYRQSYSAQEKMGGGVILDLCHEIDLALAVLGPANGVCCAAGRASRLEIDSEDIANLIIDHGENKFSSIHLNYLERSYTWMTRILGQKGSITWDYGGGFVELNTSGGHRQKWPDPQAFSRDDLFRSQMRSWIGVLAGKDKPAVDLQQGIRVSRVAIAAKTAAQEKKFIAI
jgi:predicted dehydrogenase